MITKVIFELKSNIRAWSNQIIDFNAKGFNRILINIKDINCEVVFNKVATGGWQKLQFHSYNKGCA